MSLFPAFPLFELTVSCVPGTCANSYLFHPLTLLGIGLILATVLLFMRGRRNDLEYQRRLDLAELVRPLGDETK